MNLPLPVREAVVVRLRAAVAVTAFVPAESIYGERVPPSRTFPFLAMGNPSVEAFKMACYVEGERVSFTLHGQFEGASNDTACDCAAACKAELNETVLLLEDGTKLAISWEAGAVFRDVPSVDRWHFTQDYTVA